MSKIKIEKEEIEKMLREQLGIDEIVWNKDGSVNVELDLEKLKKREVVREEHHHHHYPYYPIYIEKPVIQPKYPHWYITCTSETARVGNSCGTTSSGTLTFCNSTSSY